MEFHPIANVFPLSDEDSYEFQQFCKDIEAHGQRDPIDLFEEKILDGRDRFRACKLVGREPRFRRIDDFDIEQGFDPIAYVISKNLRRRHLSPSQAALVASKLATLQKGANQYASFEAPSQAQAAEMLGVSRSSVQRARIVQNSNPAITAAVERGDITLGAAVQIVAEPADKQKEMITLHNGDLHAAAQNIRSQKIASREAYSREQAATQAADKAAELVAEIGIGPAKIAYLILRDVIDVTAFITCLGVATTPKPEKPKPNLRAVS